MIPNKILISGALTSAEMTVIQSHPYYTRKVLEIITGFEETANWASNHHEKLNGRGYPYGLVKAKYYHTCLLGCIDIYQALTEDRPYRKAMQILRQLGL